MDKKISVIIPIYNVEKYLKPTLNSVRFQTYQNLEIICVLDCPKDNSAKIVEEIAKEDNRFKIISNLKNMGVSTARNVGVDNSTGEYLHFMDSDDLLSPGFYEIMLGAASETDADISACSVFYEKKPKQSIWFVKDEVLTGDDKINQSEVLSRGWVWRYLIRKNFWDENNFSFPDLIVMEDLIVAISMIYYANKIAVCPNAVYFYKNRENSILNKKNRNIEQKKIWKENLRNARQLKLDFIKEHKIKQPSKLRRYFRSALTKRPVCINDPIEYGKIEKKISVIIPIYNAERYLRETLNYIRFQTYQHLEIICVLDCPTDNSTKIASEIAAEDKRVKLVEHSRNRGLPAARNSGVENATGKYIHFMDSDDLLNPDFYDMMISAAEKAEADVAACSVFYEKKLWRSIWFAKSEVLSKTTDKIEKTEVAIQSWAWRYLIRKSFWNERSFSFPNLVPMEDKPVMIPMIYYANKVALCPGAVYFYKNRENSILNRKYDPVREKQRSENRKKSRKISRDFMKFNEIRRPNKWLYYLKKYIP